MPVSGPATSPEKYLRDRKRENIEKQRVMTHFTLFSQPYPQPQELVTESREVLQWTFISSRPPKQQCVGITLRKFLPNIDSNLGGNPKEKMKGNRKDE